MEEGNAMRTFETPGPISVSLDLGVGDVVLAASDREDTVVDVRPSDPTRTRDVTAAGAARNAPSPTTLSVVRIMRSPVRVLRSRSPVEG